MLLFKEKLNMRVCIKAEREFLTLDIGGNISRAEVSYKAGRLTENGATEKGSDVPVCFLQL